MSIIKEGRGMYDGLLRRVNAEEGRHVSVCMHVQVIRMWRERG